MGTQGLCLSLSCRCLTKTMQLSLIWEFLKAASKTDYEARLSAMLLIEGVTFCCQTFTTWEFTVLKWCFVFPQHTTLLSSTPFPPLSGRPRGRVSLLPSVYRALCGESLSGCQVTPPRKVLGPYLCPLTGFLGRKLAVVTSVALC